MRLRGEEIAGLPPAAVCHRGIARTFQIPRPFRQLSLLENVALAAFYGSGEHPSREEAWQLAREALDLVKLPSSPTSRVDGLGAAGLKKLELARALATRPKLLLADESLGGLDEQEMEQAADMLAMIRRERGITIVWVEHIMGALMRVVDRCIVLDHGEVIAAGHAAAGGARPAGDRGLPRHRCVGRAGSDGRAGGADADRLGDSRPATGHSRRCSASASRSSAGEAVAVIGPNGAGKTTLLRAISKLIEATAGEITHGGHARSTTCRRTR